MDPYMEELAKHEGAAVKQDGAGSADSSDITAKFMEMSPEERMKLLEELMMLYQEGMGGEQGGMGMPEGNMGM
jgi:hypothetical protein